MPLIIEPGFNFSPEVLKSLTALTPLVDRSTTATSQPDYKTEHVAHLLANKYAVTTVSGITRIAIPPISIDHLNDPKKPDELQRILVNAIAAGLAAKAETIRIAIPIQSKGHWVMAAITMNLPPASDKAFIDTASMVSRRRVSDKITIAADVDIQDFSNELMKLVAKPGGALNLTIVNSLELVPGAHSNATTSSDHYKGLIENFTAITRVPEADLIAKAGLVSSPLKQIGGDICGGLAVENVKSFLETGNPVAKADAEVAQYQKDIRAAHEEALEVVRKASTGSSFKISAASTPLTPEAISLLKNYWAKDQDDLAVTLNDKEPAKLIFDVKDAKGKDVSQITYSDKQAHISNTTKEIASHAIKAYIKANFPGKDPDKATDRAGLKLEIGSDSSAEGRKILEKVAKELGLTVVLPKVATPPAVDPTSTPSSGPSLSLSDIMDID